MTKIIICDLDGTLYKSDDRAHFIEQKDWASFHAASEHSLPNKDVLELIQSLDHFAAVELMFVAITGRNERYRDATLRWMVKHGVPISHLYMRGDDDYRKDTVLKEELLEEAMNDHDFTKEDIWFALEDRDTVVDMWRGIGVQCYQVRAGSF